MAFLRRGDDGIGDGIGPDHDEQTGAAADDRDLCFLAVADNHDAPLNLIAGEMLAVGHRDDADAAVQLHGRLVVVDDMAVDGLCEIFDRRCAQKIDVVGGIAETDVREISLSDQSDELSIGIDDAAVIVFFLLHDLECVKNRRVGRDRNRRIEVDLRQTDPRVLHVVGLLEAEAVEQPFGLGIQMTGARSDGADSHGPLEEGVRDRRGDGVAVGMLVAGDIDNIFVWHRFWFLMCRL